MNKAVIFDLDGTIYKGNSLIFNAIETINEIESLGIKVIFCTNNSTKKRYEILHKLNSFGINTSIGRIYTSSFATALYLQSKNIEKVFLVGAKSFAEELIEFDIGIVSPELAEAVVIGLDTEFNYDKISKSLEAINNGAKLIICNADKNYPVENNILKPGCNAMVSAILGSCDDKKNVDFLVGKPNTYLLEIICKDWDLDRNSIYVVGDSLESDIKMADNFGSKSLLINENICLKHVVNIIKKEML